MQFEMLGTILSVAGPAISIISLSLLAFWVVRYGKNHPTEYAYRIILFVAIGYACIGLILGLLGLFMKLA